MKSLLVGGSALLLISLVLAWLLVFIRILNVGFVKKLFPSHDHLVRAHIDFILMSLLLFAFYGLANELPMILIVLMLFGATINPSLFVVLSMREGKEMKPAPFLSLVTMLSFVSATVGFGGGAVILILQNLGAK